MTFYLQKFANACKIDKQTMSDSYTPPQNIIDKYAHVLVNFALNSGTGVKRGEVVQCIVPDVAKPMALALQNTLLKAGAHPVIRLIPSGFDRDFYNLASDEQLGFFPRKFLKARADLIDHQIGIIAESDPMELSEVDPRKIMLMRNSQKPYRDWLVTKENRNLFTWTLALWGMPAKAKEVGLSLEDYWQQIIKACFLDEADPVAKWREVFTMQEDIKKKLNDMRIQYVIVKGEDVDLTVKIGADRIWQGGSGRNIPSFEIFTSPDWRGVDGWIRFNEPLYRYGNVIRDIYLRVEHGLIVEAKAKTGNKFLQAMLETKNANKFGEFSMTDKRMSHITHPMAETLFDENIGGRFGNSHLAIGMAYKDCYRGNPDAVKANQWKAMGFNDSAEHTDMMTTTDRSVTAVLADGKEVLIYEDGQFVV
ncbi:MAG: Thermophilic metalloprotease (M29) superfamily [Candidatus Pacebacteria bacterium GW2011_GWF2_38_9]|nr:MAG: M29 family peptidase, aminopeptidase [candidate division TM6 bacterium GW2011_GWF2_28_16]KKQ88650.1 MAG: Thermophilic metalloprotease (M29) superfamily [Candidatus Pacebacteria bacterium GW2011_GWF2_38_9]